MAECLTNEKYYYIYPVSHELLISSVVWLVMFLYRAIAGLTVTLSYPILSYPVKLKPFKRRRDRDRDVRNDKLISLSPTLPSAIGLGSDR